MAEPFALQGAQKAEAFDYPSVGLEKQTYIYMYVYIIYMNRNPAIGLTTVHTRIIEKLYLLVYNIFIVYKK